VCSSDLDEPLDNLDFATRYGLDITVREREHVAPGTVNRFYASFDHCEVSCSGHMLISHYGNGATPDEAIADYAKIIRNKLLVIHAYNPARREIWAHILGLIYST